MRKQQAENYVSNYCMVHAQLHTKRKNRPTLLWKLLNIWSL